MDEAFAIPQLPDAIRRIAEATAVLREVRNLITKARTNRQEDASADARLAELDRVLAEHVAELGKIHFELAQRVAWERPG